MLDTEFGELLGGSVGEDDISLDYQQQLRPFKSLLTHLELGVNNLADDLSVGDSDHQSVLGAGVLINQHNTLPRKPNIDPPCS